MVGFSVILQGLRVIVSCIGLVGNIVLIHAIIRVKFSHVKTFELFLLAMAAANVEEIIIVNIYEVIIYQTSSTPIIPWVCRTLKFLTVFGGTTSILFTVLISIFRQQKLRDAEKRVNPIYLDSIRSAWMASGICVMLATLLSLPIFVLNFQDPVGNITRNSSRCSRNLFQCSENDCPALNRIYKYLFTMVGNLLPLIIVTVNSCFIITVLLSQRKTLTPEMSGSSQSGRKSKDPRLQHSTTAVLAAMGLFQVDWTLYLIFQLTVSPTDFPFWAETELFISTSYTSLSPYVYGIGHNLFSLKHFMKQ
ncbi:uncharacterized protein LOC117961612 [Etheostoma cragini]|uniref:uncharacterized protein LOC117961612 n=1 Tax=Etheostoma cragini TaxID=417921 RepID=UPI00155E7336|nr:uncharacterized protein LOC117961612 [Etheostoma cragini]